MSTILPLVQTAQLVTKDGTFTTQFKTYLDSIEERIGGVNGGSYTQLTVNSGAVVWDLNSGPVAVVVLANGVNTLTIINQVAGAPLYRLTLVQPASGAAGTVAWPRPPVKFPGGVAPALSTANNAVDEVVFDSDGTNMKLIVEALNFS